MARELGHLANMQNLIDLSFTPPEHDPPYNAGRAITP